MEELTRLDAGQAEGMAQRVAGGGGLGRDGDHPIGVGRARGLAVDLERQAGQQLGEARRDGPFAGQELVRALELREADGGADVRHAVVVADDVVPVFAGIGEALAAELEGQAVGRRVAHDDHAAFAGGDRLIAEETEAGGVAERAHVPVADLGAEGFGAVFDDEQALAARQGAERGHVAGLAVEVHGEDGLGAGRDAGLDVGRVDLPGPEVRIGEDGRGADVADRVDRGDVGQARDDDFVARTDAEGDEGKVDRDGAVADGEGVGRANTLGESTLETVDELAFGRDPGRIKALVDVGLLIAGKIRTIDRDADGRQRTGRHRGITMRGTSDDARLYCFRARRSRSQSLQRRTP